MFALTIAVHSPLAANGDLILTSFTGGNTGVLNADQTNGYEFVVGQQSLILSQLGFFDLSGDGLLNTHDVGIWTTAGSLIATATIPSGVTASLNGQWRMVDVAPVVLAANTTYTIGAQVFGDSYTWGLSTPGSLDAGIASLTGGSLIRNGLGLNFPDQGNDSNRFNANAFLTAVPEPSSLLMVVIAGVGLVVVRRQKRTTHVSK